MNMCRKCGDKIQKGVWCKACKNKYSKEHYQAKKLYFKEYLIRYRLERSKFIEEQKDFPCMDCGVKYPPYVMDFDHAGSVKIASVSYGAGNLGWGRTKLLEEIAKCDLVCANCHRIRTFNKREFEPWKTVAK